MTGEVVKAKYVRVKITVISKIEGRELTGPGGQTITKAWFAAKTREIAKRLPEKDRMTVGLGQAKVKELTCVLVGAKEIGRLNKQFRKKHRATDVLSFAPVEPNSLGELVFCTEVIRQQSREHGLKYRDEFLYMLIHGILHLLGYEHEKSDKKARVMYRLQDRIFAELTAPKKASRKRK